MNLFNIVFIQPITNLLVLLYKALAFLNMPYALGFAVILLTVFIRLLLYPFVSAQIKAAAKMQKVSPHLARVKELHKHDKKRQQEEIMRLYREHGVNPAAGCLPMIIQIPVIWSLYNVLTKAVGASSLGSIKRINEVLYSPTLRLDRVWDTSFFGLSLAASPAKEISHAPYIILVPLLTGLFQFLLSRMMMPEDQVAVQKKDQPAKAKADDFQSAFQTQSLFIFPVMIGFFSYTLPVGLSLYWNTFTIFGILQQYILVGPGGLKPWVEKIWKRP